MNNKQKWIIAAAIVATIGGASAAVAAESTSQSKAYIGHTKAKAIALQEVPGTIDNIELEREHGKVYYEVEVRKSNKIDEVDVHVDANTGKILAIVEDYDDDDRDKRTTSNTSSSVSPSPSANVEQKNVISKDQASKLALQAVKGEVAAVDKDRDDGVVSYEVKLKTSDGKVEVEIDATNGEVLSIDYDDHSDHDDDDDEDDYDDKD
ncbi:MAG: PepSY domain-containing protein [Candidatus Pristimantibacillus sp.]